MKKIIPFKKEIIFKTNVSEITSISLEHTLQVEEENYISGKFIVSGEYKMTSTSIDTEPFSYDLPCDIRLDEKYILDNVVIDIEDFYYEIINDTILSVNIEARIDKLEEKEIVYESEPILPIYEEEIIPDKIPVDIKEPVRCPPNEIVDEAKINSLFDNMDDSNETYKSYTIYIVRELDTLEGIIEKYNITKEEIESYNDIKEIKIGDKIVIPTNNA